MGRDRGQRHARFIPERIDLPGDASAAIVPVATVGRELVVPEDPGRVGWWDGSSYVGDPYGSTVIAGHVDTVDRGLGFFYRLWKPVASGRRTRSPTYAKWRAPTWSTTRRSSTSADRPGWC
jgi:hypothetical protein